MLTSGINFKNYKIKIKNKKLNLKINKYLNSIINEKSQLISSFKNNYKDNFNYKLVKKYKKYKNFRVIGMGGSSLGTQTIYEFLKDKVKKKIFILLII